MIKEVIIDQVKELIKRAINRFAKELNVKSADIILYISADENGYPSLKLLNKGVFVKNLKYTDLTTIIDRVTYSGLGFNIEKDMPLWIQKFILKSHDDTGLDIVKTSYAIVLLEGQLFAFMYYEGKQYKEISIDYILETK